MKINNSVIYSEIEIMYNNKIFVNLMQFKAMTKAIEKSMLASVKTV
jgi:hypothetical protein